MNGVGRVQSGLAARQGPRPHFIFADGEERFQSKQIVGDPDHPIPNRLPQAIFAQEGSGLVRRELGDLHLEPALQGDRQHPCTCGPHRRCLHPFGRVHHNQHRLEREQRETSQELLFLEGALHSPQRPLMRQPFRQALE